jgi:ubiquinone/menaquinone biosynthesis C-methylase UbiE
VPPRIFAVTDHIPGFKEAISTAAGQSDDAFFTWFNRAKNLDDSFLRANWDFAHHIAAHLLPHITEPEMRNCLEIGHGGGRLLSVAARFFSAAIGVDIHGENTKVLSKLTELGITNVKLVKTDGADLPVPDSAVDVVYSFIVLQHIEKITIFNSYLQETYRVLRPGGIALLYFGRWSQYSTGRKAAAYLWLDNLLENFKVPSGYKEIPAEINHTNLLITRRYAKAQALKYGFRFKKFLYSFKNIPEGYGRFGGQHGMLLQK